jgi:hypothetical protein
MKIKQRQVQSANLSIGTVGKRIVSTTLAIVLWASATASLADVASRVTESNATEHKGVLVFVRDASPHGRRTEKLFFGQGLRKVSVVAPDFQVQIVEPEDIPGGALPGSFVVLTPAGDRVVAMHPGCKTVTDLRALVVRAKETLNSATPTVALYFEYDH